MNALLGRIRWKIYVVSAALVLSTAPFVQSQDTTTLSGEQQAEVKYQEAKKIAADKNATAEQLKTAVNRIAEAIELAPRSCKYHFGMGILHYRLDEWEQAETWFKKSKQLESGECRTYDIDQWLALTRKKKIQTRNVLAQAGDVTIKRTINLKDPSAVKEFDILKEKPVMPVLKPNEPVGPLQRYFSDRFPELNNYWKPPFFVVGPYSEETLSRHYTRGIKDFYRFFKREYDLSDPKFVITILISSDPYQLIDIAEDIFPEENFPHYNPYFGFYSRANHLAVATIGGGYGTLLHEMMHVLLASDFPDAPLWLVEGMATLYERSAWTKTGLKPLPNWRMDVLFNQECPPLSHFDGLTRANRIGRKDLARIRLLLLFVARENRVQDLYRRVKVQGGAFDLAQTLSSFGPEYTEAEWKEFCEETEQEYMAELELSRNQLTYREVLFIQTALNRLMNAGLKEDGIMGGNTRKQIKKFQLRNALPATGEFDEKTRSLLEHEYSLLLML